MYISIKYKFIAATLFALFWAGFSIFLSLPWLHDFSATAGMIIAVFFIFGIAILPGFMNAFILVSLMMDKRPKRQKLDQYPGLTILIAAYQEESSLQDTFYSIYAQKYPGDLEVIVINDGSKDRTSDSIKREQILYPWLKFIDLPRNRGKAHALNEGLKHATYDLIITIDADCYLYRNALEHMVERFYNDPPGTKAVAGTILVRNSRENWVTKTQEWDYFHGIASVKRVQSLYQGVLVAQGAFSLYVKDALIELGGWPESIGEDIVLTWAFLKKGYRVGHSEDACIFTNVPNSVRQLIRQRRRWARGMIEGFKHHGDILKTPRFATFFIYWNLFFPWLDIAYTFGFIPGVILALFGIYWIAGPMTLILLPLALIMSFIIFRIENKMFNQEGLHVRRNFLGFVSYILFYNCILQPASVWGYINEFIRTPKHWGTK